MNVKWVPALGLLALASMAPLGLQAQDRPKDVRSAPRSAFQGRPAFTGPQEVAEVWVTTPGVIFILEEMPEQVRYFSADRNSGLKLDLLLKAVERRWKVAVVYDSADGETREAIEIRLAAPTRAD